MNDTLVKFGYPDSVIHSYTHWSVLLRPRQVTLGSLILACHSHVTAFSEVPSDAMDEFSTIIPAIESVLTRCFKYDKINYLMLMMVDPHVHFHVIPRYQEAREFASMSLQDADWPGPPDLSRALNLSAEQLAQLQHTLCQQWSM